MFAEDNRLGKGHRFIDLTNIRHPDKSDQYPKDIVYLFDNIREYCVYVNSPTSFTCWEGLELWKHFSSLIINTGCSEEADLRPLQNLSYKIYIVYLM